MIAHESQRNMVMPEKEPTGPSVETDTTQQSPTSVEGGEAVQAGSSFNEQTKYMPPLRIITVSRVS